MTILCLSISYRMASIELREQLSLGREEVATALSRFNQWSCTHVSGDAELAVISTCNRLELYLATHDDRVGDSFKTLARFTAEVCDLQAAHFEPYVHRYDDIDAVEHLCRVAAGLESMVLGESQILGQVSDSFEIALMAGSVGPVLSTVFRTAIRTGKRAQTETTIGHNPSSVGSVAVLLAEQVMGPATLSDAQVLVVGAGEMAELVIKALHARGIKRMTVANRTHAHAVVLAQRWGGVACDLSKLSQAIGEADMIITSTGAPQPIIRFGHIQHEMQSRPHRPLVLIDIAMPRDIEPAAGDVDGVRLFNLDDLQSHLDGSISDRRAQVPFVEAIVNNELTEFAKWLRGAKVHPVITDLRKKAEAIRQHEIERTLRHLPDLDAKTREYIQGMSRALVNKLLHEPTNRLRDAANDGLGVEYANSVRYLFGLSGDEPWQAPGQDER